jgi:HTH-type transcriptional regulator/antitoxin HigA
MGRYRTLSEFTESYFRAHPEEIDDYIKLIFADYEKDGDAGALLSQLRVLSRVKGVSKSLWKPA